MKLQKPTKTVKPQNSDSTDKFRLTEDDSKLSLDLDMDLLIPVLDEQVLEDTLLEKFKQHALEEDLALEKAAKSNMPPAPESKQPGAQPNQAAHQHNNPFLPYEHLEQLAKERELFRQELEQFTQNMAQKSHKNALGNNASLPLWAKQIKEEILQEIKPIIEKQVRQILAEEIMQSSDH